MYFMKHTTFRLHRSRTNPALLLLPTIVFESFFGMRNGPDSWKLYVGWLRFEVGISWHAKR